MSEQFVPATPRFKIPESVPPVAVELTECGNCHTATPTGELSGGICHDCIAAAEREAALAMPPEDDLPPLTILPDGTTPDELATRRTRRQQVKAATVAAPQGWLQHAVEGVRMECVRARTGHEFTIDTVLDNMERARAPMPPTTELQGAAALRFVMEEAIKRGWCEQTDRLMPSRREDTAGKRLRIYRSTL